jgi:hypothetical protein
MARFRQPGEHDPTKNFPGGSDTFDEEHDPNEVEPDNDIDDTVNPAAPRNIFRSPFGSWMDRERKLR